MAQQGEINQIDNVKGLFTEGSPLNFPAGATVRDENFILNIDGSRERRFGLGQEADVTPPASESEGASLTGQEVYVFDWDAVGNSGDLNFSVILRNGRIQIYDKSVEPLADGLRYDDFFTFGGNNNNNVVSGTAINGKFILVGDGNEEIQIYDFKNGAVQKEDTVIKVRDIWGVDDPLEIDERVKSLSSQHAYNIANQGWNFAQARQVRDVGVSTTVVTDIDFLSGPNNVSEETTETILIDKGGWPSNADLVTYGLSETDEADRFKEGLYSAVPFGTTPAPRGSCVMSLTNTTQDRFDFAVKEGYEDYINIEDFNDSVSTGPKAVASYAGRVFYAGFTQTGNQVNSTYPDLTSVIAFSRSIRNKEDIAKCYQEADPSTLDGDIVDSDGGTLTITGTGFIYRLINTGRSLLIFASEGVWELYSTDQLFSATNYQIRKVTSVGCKSPRTVLLAENVPMYWTDYGIYSLQPDQVSQGFIPKNMTADVIQSFYDDIDSVSIRTASGFYDKFDKKVRWLYSSTGDAGSYDRELILDIRLQSWYTNTFTVPSDKAIVGYTDLNTFSEINASNNIIAGSDNVISGTDNIIANTFVPDKGKRSYKYVLNDINNLGLSRTVFYEFNNSNFEDFGVTDAEAVMITGPLTSGDSVRRKGSTYLTTQMRKTETGFEDVAGEILPINPGSCIVESRWDFTDLAVAGKFNNPIEMYRHRRHYIPASLEDEYDDGYPVLTTKSRLRGSGRSLALKITSSPRKDLNLLGYNIQLSVNEKV